jgi:putative hemolysin
MQSFILGFLGENSWSSNLLQKFRKGLDPRFYLYSPHEKIYLETSNYILKTADCTSELEQAFKLRYQSFLESTEGQDGSVTYDLDKFDHVCDHIIIKDKESNSVIGTYRIISSLYNDTFYSHGEFKIEKFLAEDGIKMELGRACIDPSFRDGKVLDLLWKGIATYATRINAKYLFGCSSIKIVHEDKIAAVHQYLDEKGWLSEQWDIKVQPAYNCVMTGDPDKSKIAPKEMVPPLIKSYITAGAKVLGGPALDVEFECIDYLTILNLEEISPLFKRRYFKDV